MSITQITPVMVPYPGKQNQFINIAPFITSVTDTAEDLAQPMQTPAATLRKAIKILSISENELFEEKDIKELIYDLYQIEEGLSKCSTVFM